MIHAATVIRTMSAKADVHKRRDQIVTQAKVMFIRAMLVTLHQCEWNQQVAGTTLNGAAQTISSLSSGNNAIVTGSGHCSTGNRRGETTDRACYVRPILTSI